MKFADHRKEIPVSSFVGTGMTGEQLHVNFTDPLSWQRKKSCMKKWFLILLFICFLCSVFSKTFASTFGDDSVTLKLKKAPLRTALKKIQDQSQIKFFYGDELVEGISVSCDVKNFQIDDALIILLENTDLEFKQVKKNHIVLFQKKKNEYYTLAGRVADAFTGEVLPQANISIPGTCHGTTTNTEGRFILCNVPTTHKNIRFRYIGYSTKDVAIEPQLSSKTVQIKLQQAALPTQSVTVKAENWDIFHIEDQVSRVAISPIHFSNLPIIGDKDIARSLQLMPGIVSSNYGSSGLQIRGGLPSHNLILLDGMTLYHMNHSLGFFSTFNSDAIKDVRVYKGGFPAKFGGRLSGIMELTTKTGDLNRFRLGIGMNQTSGQTVLEIPVAGKGALLVSYRRSFSNYILGSLYDRVYSIWTNNNQYLLIMPDSSNQLAPTQTSKDINFYDIISKLTLTPTSRDILTFSYFAGQDNIKRFQNYTLHQPLDSYMMVDIWNDINEKVNWANSGLGLKWYRHWNNKINSTFLLTSTDYSTNYNMTDKYIVNETAAGGFAADNLSYSSTYLTNIRNNVKDLTFRLDNNLYLNENSTFDFGGTLTKTTIYYEMKNIIGGDFPDEEYGFRQNSTSQLIAAYVQNNWLPLKEIRILAGIRFNHYLPQKKYSSKANSWEPRISFLYNFSPSFSVKGAWGQYHQYVLQFSDDLGFMDGNVSWIMADNDFIEPGFSEHNIIGMQYESSDFLFDIEFYSKKLEGLVNFVAGDDVFIEDSDMFNSFQTSGFARGLDIIFQKKTGRFTGWASYSFSKTQVKNIGNGEFYPANQDVPHNLKLVGNTSLDKWNFSATWHYASGKPYNKPQAEPYIDEEDFSHFYSLYKPQKLNNSRLPFNHRLDISIARSIKTKFFAGKFGCSIFNVYNQKNVWYRYHTIKNARLFSIDVNMFGFMPTFFCELRF